MKVLYLINLFFACSSFFIIQPSYLPIRYNHNSSISSNFKINNKKSLINVKNENENLIIIKKIILNFIYYITIYIYINIYIYIIFYY